MIKGGQDEKIFTDRLLSQKLGERLATNPPPHPRKPAHSRFPLFLLLFKASPSLFLPSSDNYHLRRFPGNEAIILASLK